MRLSKIKLAGFKSFVDPTTLILPSNIMGVVGPNGCGKSNIIDAVRWVMGESSPRLLRGDAMSDVIFSGSRTRKPVGMASVELVFDNSRGKIGGEFANFTEISAKRSLGRDGQSEYRLNGTRCRRRDITNLFLGTGIGPRSYAIIEQGTISRLVDAKPEELRVFLEEAAGITVYKERRRETETRIRHTLENLERLDDLREEVAKQLAHLKRQAAAAERYKKLRAERKRVWATQQATRLRQAQHLAAAGAKEIAAADVVLEQHQAAIRRAEANIERGRLQRGEAQEVLNGVQERVYQTSSSISRLEQAIQHAENSSAKAKKEIAEIEAQLKELERHAGADAEKASALAQQIAALEPAREAAGEHLSQSESVLSDAETALAEWRQEQHQFQQRQGEARRDREVEQVRLDQYQRRIADLQARQGKLLEELDALTPGPAQKAVLEAQTAHADVTGALQRAEKELLRLSGEYADTRARLGEAREALDSGRADLRTLDARRAALDALQQTAFGARESKSRRGPLEWLQETGIKGERLAQAITVRGGWEKAVEAVLGGWLAAVLVDEPSDWLQRSTNLQHGHLRLLCGRGQLAHGDPAHLSHYVSGPAALASLFEGVCVAETVAAAGEMLVALPKGASVVTRDGQWVGHDRLQVTGAGAEATGVLVREQEIRKIRSQYTRQEKRVSVLLAEVDQGESQLMALATSRDVAQTHLAATQKQAGECHAGLVQARGQLEQVLHRVAELESLRQQLDEQALTENGHIQQTTQRIGELDRTLRTLEVEGRELEDANRRLLGYLDAAQSNSSEARDQMQQLEIQLQSRRAEERSQRTTMQRLAGQREQHSMHLERLHSEAVDAEAPLPGLRKELKQALDASAELDKELAIARGSIEQAEQALTASEKGRAQGERQLEQARAELERLRLRHQESVLQADNIARGLLDAGEDPATMVESLPESKDATDFEQQIETLERKIQRLEPVNLAAIEEHQAQTQRQEYLDGQHQDLLDALDTLRQAIRKIDTRTRARFKRTFEKVNDGFGELFPKLFGGGHAFLQLTSDDLLTAGVRIMARPPGKRVSNLNLLSGGEKALTAVALVFAIFDLNPAPFCLLDEVDAPLDEANVGRFSELVREISQKVQILFVSHNKTTMEIAHQLTGITMVEPGVSRLVSVDVLDAVAV